MAVPFIWLLFIQKLNFDWIVKLGFVMDLIVFYCDWYILLLYIHRGTKTELYVMPNHSNCNLNTWLSFKIWKSHLHFLALTTPWTADIQTFPVLQMTVYMVKFMVKKKKKEEERVEPTYNIWKQWQIDAD